MIKLLTLALLLFDSAYSSEQKQELSQTNFITNVRDISDTLTGRGADLLSPTNYQFNDNFGSSYGVSFTLGGKHDPKLDKSAGVNPESDLIRRKKRNNVTRRNSEGHLKSSRSSQKEEENQTLERVIVKDWWKRHKSEGDKHETVIDADFQEQLKKLVNGNGATRRDKSPDKSGREVNDPEESVIEEQPQQSDSKPWPDFGHKSSYGDEMNKNISKPTKLSNQPTSQDKPVLSVQANAQSMNFDSQNHGNIQTNYNYNKLPVHGKVHSIAQPKEDREHDHANLNSTNQGNLYGNVDKQLPIIGEVKSSILKPNEDRKENQVNFNSKNRGKHHGEDQNKLPINGKAPKKDHDRENSNSSTQELLHGETDKKLPKHRENSHNIDYYKIISNSKTEESHDEDIKSEQASVKKSQIFEERNAGGNREMSEVESEKLDRLQKKKKRRRFEENTKTVEVKNHGAYHQQNQQIKITNKNLVPKKEEYNCNLETPRVRLCYLENLKSKPFGLEKLPKDLCTHLAYENAEITIDHDHAELFVHQIDRNEQTRLKNELKNMKQKGANLKALLAVNLFFNKASIERLNRNQKETIYRIEDLEEIAGSFFEGHDQDEKMKEKFKALKLKPITRKEFIKLLITLMDIGKYDGIFLNWSDKDNFKYPANFIGFLVDLQKSFEKRWEKQEKIHRLGGKQKGQLILAMQLPGTINQIKSINPGNVQHTIEVINKMDFVVIPSTNDASENVKVAQWLRGSGMSKGDQTVERNHGVNCGKIIVEMPTLGADKTNHKNSQEDVAIEHNLSHTPSAIAERVSERPQMSFPTNANAHTSERRNREGRYVKMDQNEQIPTNHEPTEKGIISEIKQETLSTEKESLKNSSRTTDKNKIKNPKIKDSAIQLNEIRKLANAILKRIPSSSDPTVSTFKQQVTSENPALVNNHENTESMPDLSDEKDADEDFGLERLFKEKEQKIPDKTFEGLKRLFDEKKEEGEPKKLTNGALKFQQVIRQVMKQNKLKKAIHSNEIRELVTAISERIPSRSDPTVSTFKQQITSKNPTLVNNHENTERMPSVHRKELVSIVKDKIVNQRKKRSAKAQKKKLKKPVVIQKEIKMKRTQRQNHENGKKITPKMKPRTKYESEKATLKKAERQKKEANEDFGLKRLFKIPDKTFEDFGLKRLFDEKSEEREKFDEKKEQEPKKLTNGALKFQQVIRQVMEQNRLKKAKLEKENQPIVAKKQPRILEYEQMANQVKQILREFGGTMVKVQSDLAEKKNDNNEEFPISKLICKVLKGEHC